MNSFNFEFLNNFVILKARFIDVIQGLIRMLLIAVIRYSLPT
jgi:hypothetical protein